MGLFFPDNCVVCGRPLVKQEQGICLHCIQDAPATLMQYETHPNTMENIFMAHFPITEAWAMWTFSHDSKYRNVIHDVKYNGNRRLGVELGRIAAREINQNNLFREVDYIVPIPLHWKRRWKRGFNQAELITQGMSEIMHLPVISNRLKRTTYNDTQTSLNKEERQQNVRNIFTIKNPEDLAGKHVLLVDDVCTTGSTLISAAETLRDAVQDIKISVFSVYTT